MTAPDIHVPVIHVPAERVEALRPLTLLPEMNPDAGVVTIASDDDGGMHIVLAGELTPDGQLAWQAIDDLSRGDLSLGVAASLSMLSDRAHEALVDAQATLGLPW